MNERIVGDQTQDGRPQDDADEQFADDGRHADPAAEVAGQCCGD